MTGADYYMKEQKKIGIWLLLTGGLVGIFASLQRLIFLRAKKSDKPSLPKNSYAWKQGACAYEVIGSGRPLLLLHSTIIGASHNEWEKNIKLLSMHFQVFAVDLPGFGASARPKITYTAYQYALFINNFIEDVIKAPSSILASSAAADYAIMACRMTPENFRRLLLISPTGVNSQPANNKESRYRRLLQSPFIGTQLFIRQASKKSLREMLRHDVFFAQELASGELINRHYYFAHYGGLAARFAYASTASGFTRTDISAAFADLRLPILLIWGQDNRGNPTSKLEALKKLRPTAEYAIFEHTRLLPQYENSKGFNEAALRFLK